MSNLELWLQDLETTTDPQTTGVLTNHNGDCCLGRLCKVAIANGVDVEVTFDPDWGDTIYAGERAAPPQQIMEWADIDDELVRRSINMNDTQRLTFKQIAQEIRKGTS